jgi:hypothetical protein
MAFGGTERVTTAPAATMALLPMVMPGRMVAPDPIEAHRFHQGLQELRWRFLAARKPVIGERCVGPDKNIVAHPQAVPQLHATLDRDAIPNENVVFDQAVRANVAVDPDLGTRQHNDELPDARADTNRGGPHVCQGMDKGVGHRLNALLLIADDGRSVLA